MDTVDAVAHAIYMANAQNWLLLRITPWDEVGERGRENYRRMAQAAIDALGLNTVELLHNGEHQCSRLVSGWVRKDNTNE